MWIGIQGINRLRTHDKKRVFILVLAAFVVLTLIGWFVFERLAIHNDRLRFEDASNVKTEVTNRLVTYLGNNVMSTREQDECFNAAQSPYDNGKLWCQVATVIRLKGDVDFSTLGKQFLAMARQEGKAASMSGSGVTQRFWLMSQSMSCQLSNASYYSYTSLRRIGRALLG